MTHYPRPSHTPAHGWGQWLLLHTILATTFVLLIAACGGGGGNGNGNSADAFSGGANHAQAEDPGAQYSASWATASVLDECRAGAFPDAEVLRVYSQWDASSETGTTSESDHWEAYAVSPSDPTQVCGGLVRHENRTHDPAGQVNYAPGYQWQAGETITDWRVDSTDIPGFSWFSAEDFPDGFYFDLRPAAHHRSTGAAVPEEVDASDPVIRIAPTPGSFTYVLLHAVTGEVLFTSFTAAG